MLRIGEFNGLLDMNQFTTASDYAAKNKLKLSTVQYRCRHDIYKSIKIKGVWYCLKDKTGYVT
jgi:hypothetical protein